MGRLFGLCVIKGAELDDTPANWATGRKKYKYRVVFQSNRVVDQDMKAQFQDMGSAPATIEAPRMCTLNGLLKATKSDKKMLCRLASKGNWG